jgi:hypothetical protein
MLWYPSFLNLSKKNIILINVMGKKHEKSNTSHGKTVAFGGNMVTY